MANSVDPDQTAPIGAVCSGSTLFASILNLSVLLGNFLQQTTTADEIFRYIFFLALEGLMNLCSCKHTYYFLGLTGFLGNGDRSENNIPGSRKTCQFCMKTFKGKGDLARHLFNHVAL